MHSEQKHNLFWRKKLCCGEKAVTLVNSPNERQASSRQNEEPATHKMIKYIFTGYLFYYKCGIQLKR